MQVAFMNFQDVPKDTPIRFQGKTIGTVTSSKQVDGQFWIEGVVDENIVFSPQPSFPFSMSANGKRIEIK